MPFNYFAKHATIKYSARFNNDYDFLSMLAHFSINARQDNSLKEDFSFEIAGDDYIDKYQLWWSGKEVVAPNGFKKQCNKSVLAAVVVSMCFGRWEWDMKRRSENGRT